MSESEPRCQECGSWDRACSNPTPVFGCGCARCLSATVDALRVERDQAVQQAYRNLTVSLEATARAEKAEAEVAQYRAMSGQSGV